MALEPRIDTPQWIAEYAVNRGVTIDEQVQLLVASDTGFPDLLEELSVPVSYTEDSVAVHDVVLYLFDANACVARTYSFVISDLSEVINDLSRLVDEAESSSPSVN